MSEATTTSNLTAIHGFIRATAGDLPEPLIVSADSFGVTVHLATHDGLREWAAYFFTTPAPHVTADGTIHHRALLSHDGVVFRCVYLEDAPAGAVA
jgi:hypothetical protein